MDKDFAGFDGGMGITLTMTQKDFSTNAKNPTTTSITTEEKMRGNDIYVKMAMSGATKMNVECFYTVKDKTITSYTPAESAALSEETTDVPDSVKGKYVQDSYEGTISVGFSVSSAVEDMDGFTYDKASGCYKAELIEDTHPGTVIDKNGQLVEATLYDKYTNVVVKFENGKLVSIKCNVETYRVQSENTKTKAAETSVDMEISYDITINMPTAESIITKEQFNELLQG